LLLSNRPEDVQYFVENGSGPVRIVGPWDWSWNMDDPTFTGLLGCELPLQMAGMGGMGSNPELIAAVSNAGGLGMIALAWVPAPSVGQLIDATAALTSKPFGVNFLMPFLDRDAVAAAAPRARLVEFFYGDPDASLVDLAHDGGALTAWQVGSGDEARAAVDAGCDVVIAQGNEAGGHVRGTQPLDETLRSVLGAVSVPVVAAGGIGTAARVKAVIDAGASAVRIGTRFVASRESEAHPDYIAALIAASADDTELTETFGLDWPNAPHRVLKSSLLAAQAGTDQVVGATKMGPMEIPVERFSGMWPSRDATGDIAAMCMYAGTSVDGVHDVKPADEIVAELCSEL
jgi:NAD(P)H-dependent flavin oxidoreductase YrpB (nitropropane dioxygenase family)